VTVGDGRRLHVGVFVGLSAAAYGMSLAAVTALQAQSDAAVAADRAPAQEAFARLAADHDSLEARGQRASYAYDQTTSAYERMTQALTTVEMQLGGLARTVGSVEGVARSLPDPVALPTVVRAATTISPTTVHATTGGSGH
jgi:hypothetical protein